MFLKNLKLLIKFTKFVNLTKLTQTKVAYLNMPIALVLTRRKELRAPSLRSFQIGKPLKSPYGSQAMVWTALL